MEFVLEQITMSFHFHFVVWLIRFLFGWFYFLVFWVFLLIWFGIGFL